MFFANTGLPEGTLVKLPIVVRMVDSDGNERTDKYEITFEVLWVLLIDEDEQGRDVIIWREILLNMN